MSNANGGGAVDTVAALEAI